MKHLILIITLVILLSGAGLVAYHYHEARNQYNYELALDVAEGDQP